MGNINFYFSHNTTDEAQLTLGKLRTDAAEGRIHECELLSRFCPEDDNIPRDSTLEYNINAEFIRIRRIMFVRTGAEMHLHAYFQNNYPSYTGFEVCIKPGANVSFNDENDNDDNDDSFSENLD